MYIIEIRVLKLPDGRWRGVCRLEAGGTIEIERGTFAEANAFCIQNVERINR